MWRNKGHANKHAAFDQPVEHSLGKGTVLPAIDCDKISRRRQAAETICRRNLCNRLTRCAYVCECVSKIALILKGLQSANLTGAVHAEVIADFVKGHNERRSTKGIANTRAGQTIGFRKRPHTDDARIFDFDRGGRAFWGKFDIGFIQYQKAALWQALKRLEHVCALAPRRHWVVWVGKIDKLCPSLAGLFKKRGQILMIVAVCQLVQDAAKARDMVVKGRIGSIGGHDSVTLLDKQAHEIAQKPVYALADHDVLRSAAVVQRQRGTQIMVFAFTIHPDVF